MDVSFPPGRTPEWPGPLQRFLPPLEEGVVANALEDLGGAGDLVFDPFGTSPRLVREAAAAGRRVLVAANNPVTRFVLEHTLSPFKLTELQSALAHIASAAKDGSRMEPFLLDLYRTNCSRCGESLAADMFIWEKEARVPVLKVYACAECGNAVQETVSQSDKDLALSFEGRGLHYALALQRVVPAQDPDRRHAEAALAIYPGRALYGLTTLLNKLDQLSLSDLQRSAAQALMLSAFDSSNALWDHPEGRERPLQLSPSTQYREMNVWRAMERAVAEWVVAGPVIECSSWNQGELPEAGSVAVFPGPVRELASQLPADSVQQVVTVLPRPNQPYWTLSALWAAWLWGRKVAAPIMAALRRRKYGWAWHATALRAGLNHVRPVMEGGGPVMAFMPEAEPGFVAASLAGFDKAGFAITGRAMRHDTDQALFKWTAASIVTLPVEEQLIAQRIKAATTDLLRQRAEPTPYALLHAAVVSDLAQRRLLSASWQRVGSPPLSLVGAELATVLEDGEVFMRLDQRTEVETGVFWLKEPRGVQTPLADRVEALVLERLRQGDQVSELEIEKHVGVALPGLLTPDRSLMMACLQSYAEALEGQDEWRLREDETEESRSQDCARIKEQLVDLGKRLGYSVRGDDPIEWREPKKKIAYRFHVQETAAMQMILEGESEPAITLVLPGGRGALVAEKSRRDARIRMWIEAGNGIVKFRHIRRLVDDAKLQRETFAERLALDPVELQDPQLHLL
jgi:hypothetical protein